MNPRHHLDPSTVVSYASGALTAEMSVLVATHLDVCAECRRSVQRAEHIGGRLMEQQQAVHMPSSAKDTLRLAMLEKLDRAEPRKAPSMPDPQAIDPDRLPAPLHPYFGTSYSALKWRWMGPGMHYLRTTGPSGGVLLMLKIGSGKRMPVHGHGGSELTQILRGAYDDALGHFAAGDMADLDGDIEHQPITAAGEPCICVAALDAPLRFPGWLARTLQPIFGI